MAASKACRSKLLNIKYLAGDKSKLKAIKTWSVNHAAALVCFFTKALKFGGFEGTVLAFIASHCLAALVERAFCATSRRGLACSLFRLVGGAHLRHERQARSDVLSLDWWQLV